MDSSSGKPQFDAALGGDVEIPPKISVRQLVKSRIDEIEALTNIIECPSSTIMFNQKFPKHLRRRAMSQNLKRFPTRLRDEHISKREKSGIRETPLKRPRRKYRRRPSNLLVDYNRRQKTHIWLETHIWHAKRFHMVEKWGYKLPLHPNDKSYRACYRATTKHCLIQDISYYCCIELSGKMDELIKGLNMHCSNECGLTFNSTYIQSGCYEGSVFFYQRMKFPDGAIGEIRYFWKPQEIDSIRVLWLWCHPSFYYQVIEELVQTFSLHLEENMIVDDNQLEECSEKDVEKTKLICRNVPFVKTPKYKSGDTSVRMVLLKDTLNRFRLTGPLSQAIITQAFRPVDLTKRTIQDWTVGYKEKNYSASKKQLEFLEKMKNFSSPGQLPRHLIISSIVADPRFSMPTSRRKAEPHIEEFHIESSMNTEAELSWSAIWSSTIRDEVTNQKLSAHQLNEMRSNKLVPGLEIESKETNYNNLPAVPIILIQHPGEDNEIKPLGYGSGWDIIVPCGYGVPFWLSFNFHGGRAGGLKEHGSILQEQCRIMFPPDTKAGRDQEKCLQERDTDTFYKLPPAKRQNYIKLGIPTPFHCPWETLIQDWTGKKEYYVLRDRKKLVQLKNKLKDITQEFSFNENDFSALVPVIIKLKDKGTFMKNSHICIPENIDIQTLSQDKDFSGPTESQHNDLFETKRKTSRTEHKTLLKRLARKRRKERKSNESNVVQSSKDIVAGQQEVMRELWLPSCDTIKDHCSRTVFGFICDADYSFTSGKSVGVGYVTLKGFLEYFKLLNAIQKSKHYVLVRNVNTNQYRFAEIIVIL